MVSLNVMNTVITFIQSEGYNEDLYPVIAITQLLLALLSKNSKLYILLSFIILKQTIWKHFLKLNFICYFDLFSDLYYCKL